MTQNSLVVANGSGATVRAGMNGAFEALVTLNAGTAAPSPTYPNMPWADTTTGILKRRNNANNAWISVMTLAMAFSTFGESLGAATDASAVRTLLGISNHQLLTVDSTGRLTVAAQPKFLAWMQSTLNNVTGNAADYTIIWDLEGVDTGGNYNAGTGVFTAPITGTYLLTFALNMQGLTSAMTSGLAVLVTSNRSYQCFYNPWNMADASGRAQCIITVPADMDAGDTAYCKIQISGAAGNTADINGSGNPASYFSGVLLPC